MAQIGQQEFRDAVAATKKDAKLVAAAKNDRLATPEGMYGEFSKLPVERQRDILVAIANDYFVAAQWKISFPLNNAPAAVLPDMVKAAGRALFYSRDEDCLREAVRAVRIYQDGPFVKQIAQAVADAAEMTRSDLARVCRAITSPNVYGIIKDLDPALGTSEKIVAAACKIAAYTRNEKSTEDAARFLVARRYSPVLPDLASLLENAIFLARDRRSVQQILTGLSAGGVDVVLQRAAGDRQKIGAIRDFAWKAREWKAIRDFLVS